MDVIMKKLLFAFALILAVYSNNLFCRQDHVGGGYFGHPTIILSNLETLPDEIKLHICNQLPVEELFKLRKVSKDFRRLLSVSEITRIFNDNKDKYDHDCLLHYIAHHVRHRPLFFEPTYNYVTNKDLNEKYVANVLQTILEDEQYTVDMRDDDNQTALHIATKYRNYHCIKELIKQGADIEALNSLQNTPLHKTALYGNYCCTKKLIQAGADVNAQNFVGWTPLHFAIAHNNGYWRHKKTITELLKAGARTDIANQFYVTPEQSAWDKDKATWFSIKVRKFIKKITACFS